MRNLLTIIFFITGLVLFVQMVQAKTADEIISRYNEARGGIEALNKIHSVYMEGTREIMDEIIPVKILKVQNRLSRIDFELFEKKGFVIVRPDKGWISLFGTPAEIRALTALELASMQSELDIAGPLFNYALKGNEVELIGKEELNGSAVYKIKLSYPSGKFTTYYIDRQSNLVVQSRDMCKTDVDSKDLIQETVSNFSDYKYVDGILFPHNISNPGVLPIGGKTTITDIRINIYIPEEQYHPC